MLNKLILSSFIQTSTIYTYFLNLSKMPFFNIFLKILSHFFDFFLNVFFVFKKIKKVASKRSGPYAPLSVYKSYSIHVANIKN